MAALELEKSIESADCVEGFAGFQFRTGTQRSWRDWSWLGPTLEPRFFEWDCHARLDFGVSVKNTIFPEHILDGVLFLRGEAKV
jgi:hypothetical protein